MDKVDRIINIVRHIKEEMSGMTTGSSGPVAGFSGSADPKGPFAGYDPVMDGRSRIMRRLPKPYSKFLRNKKK